MNFLSTMNALERSCVPSRPSTTGPPRPVLLVVEGRNDLEFLLRMSRLLYRDQALEADLGMLLASHYVVALPLGGELTWDWVDRLAPLGCCEFYLFDRELEPQTAYRQELVQRLTNRPHCCARLTSKRSLENFLHPAAIEAAGGDRISFGDDENVAAVLAEHRWQCTNPSVPWVTLPRRARQRFANRTKRWLNTTAADAMTPGWLANRDPAQEIRGWLSIVLEMIGGLHWMH